MNSMLLDDSELTLGAMPTDPDRDPPGHGGQALQLPPPGSG